MFPRRGRPADAQFPPSSGRAERYNWVMSTIKIAVKGVNYSEAIELAGLLEGIDGVTSASAPYRILDRALAPNRFGFIVPELHEAAQAHPILIGLGAFLATEYASGAI